MKIKRIIPLILLALFSSFVGINQASAGNADAGGGWDVDFTPSDMEVIRNHVATFSDGSTQSWNTYDIYPVTLQFPGFIQQAADGTRLHIRNLSG